MAFEEFNEEVFRALPELFKNLTEEFEGRERDIVLLSSIGAISGVLPNIYGLYGGSEVSANLYVVILAPAASGKGVMNNARKLIAPIDKKIYENSRKEIDKWKKEKSGKMPKVRVKIIPGNITSSDLYEKFKSSDFGSIIFESEIDTLNAIMKTDFGDFSDVLRKAFHHEPLSISRKMDNQLDRISNPKLSLILSGTPDQLGPFIKSSSNGLFSRILYYYFNDIRGWKDVFSEDNNRINQNFQQGANILFELYAELRERESPLEIEFTVNQKSEFNTKMGEILTYVTENKNLDFISAVKRNGLMTFRIAMILTVIRNRDDLCKKEKIYCSDIDFETSLILSKSLIKHADTVFDLRKIELLPYRDRKLFDKLTRVFETSQAIKIGEKMNIPKRTMFDKLKEWCSKRLIVKIHHGKYRKI
jgi:hypothetical protein